MADSAKKFTSYSMPPPVGGVKIGLRSPILESYGADTSSTMGVVTSYTETAEDELDQCEVLFRGKTIRAACCHPDFFVGMSVAIIEQPIGKFWATALQRSWYSRPLAELADKGHKTQAAVEYLLSKGAKWQPMLIIIDKRGVEPGPEPEPEPGYMPLDFTKPDFVIGYTREQWPYDPALFDLADTNGDGFVDEAELKAFLLANPGIGLLSPTGNNWFAVFNTDENGNIVSVSFYMPFKITSLGYLIRQSDFAFTMQDGSPISSVDFYDDPSYGDNIYNAQFNCMVFTFLISTMRAATTTAQAIGYYASISNWPADHYIVMFGKLGEAE